MKGQLPRSQQYIYLQNKAFHYDRLKNIRSTINNTSLTSRYRYEIDSDGFIHDRKYRKSLKRQQSIQNQRMMERIVNIIKSPRVEVQIQGGYSKFNQPQREYLKVKKDRIQQKWALQIDNSNFADRIISVKPEVGSRKKWDNDFMKFQEQKNQISRFNSQKRKKSRLQLHHGPYLPRHISSILNQSELQEIRSNKKIRLKYDRLFQLPQIKYDNKLRGSQTIDIQKSKA